MSGTSIDSGRRLGPSESPSIQDKGIDLSNASLDPVEDRVSAGVRHQGDSAWKANQLAPQAPREQRSEVTLNSSAGNARESTTVSSDFQGINEVGEQEYKRTLASMVSDGASLEQAYKAADLMRNRVTSVGGTDIARSREALQAEQGAEPLAELAADTNTEGNRQGLQDRFAEAEDLKNGIAEREAIDLAESIGVAEGVSDELSLDEWTTMAIAEGLEEGIARDEMLGVDISEATANGLTEELATSLQYEEANLLGIEESGSLLDLEVARQFEVVKGLKEERVRELTGVAEDPVAVEEELDPELLAAVEEQFNQVRDAMNARVAVLEAQSVEVVTSRQDAQRLLGAKELDALTF